jgi:hypothetical protein
MIEPETVWPKFLQKMTFFSSKKSAKVPGAVLEKQNCMRSKDFISGGQGGNL